MSWWMAGLSAASDEGTEQSRGDRAGQQLLQWVENRPESCSPLGTGTLEHP